jgi:hypothetical protein
MKVMAGPWMNDSWWHGEVGEEVGDFESGPPVPAEREGRGHEPAVAGPHELQVEAVGVEAGRQGLSVETAEDGLGIKGLEVAGPAGHEEEDDAACGAGEVRRPGRQRVGGGAGCVAGQLFTQGKAAEAEGGAAQEVAAAVGRVHAAAVG